MTFFFSVHILILSIIKTTMFKKLMTFPKTNEQISKLFPRENCVVCILGPALTFCSKIGITLLTSTCPHTKTKNNKLNFEISSSSFVLSYLLDIVLICGAICHIYVLVQSQSKIPALQAISELLFCFCTFWIQIMGRVHLKKRRNAFVSWIILFENKKIFAIKSIVSKKKAIHIKKIFTIYLYSVGWFTVLYTCYFVWLLYDRRFDLLVLSKFASFISIIVQLHSVVVFTSKAFFFHGLIENLKFHLIETLKKVHFSTKKKQFSKEDHFQDDFVNIEDIIVRLRKYYHCIIQNLKYLDSTLDVSVVVWLSLILSILVINIYIIIYCALVGEINIYTMVLEAKTNIVIFCVFHLLVCIQKVENMVSFLIYFIENI